MSKQEWAQGLEIQGFEPPLSLQDFKLIAFDMDSTLVTTECVDEIADVVGKKAEVAAITEATMQGIITDFKESLRQRVALLKGVTLEQLEQVLNERVQLTPGAETLLQACQQAGLKTILVSGGFTFFADRTLGLLFARAQWGRGDADVQTGMGTLASPNTLRLQTQPSHYEQARMGPRPGNSRL